MVDHVLNWGEAGCVSDLSDTERTIKTTTRKRKPDVSPNLRNKLEEELRLVVMGYEFQENENNLEEKLVKDILKEGAEAPGRVKIVWKKGKVDNKRSIGILETGNKWTQDFLLKNQKPGKKLYRQTIHP